MWWQGWSHSELKKNPIRWGEHIHHRGYRIVGALRTRSQVNTLPMRPVRKNTMKQQQKTIQELPYSGYFSHDKFPLKIWACFVAGFPVTPQWLGVSWPGQHLLVHMRCVRSSPLKVSGWWGLQGFLLQFSMWKCGRESETQLIITFLLYGKLSQRSPEKRRVDIYR